MADTLKTAPQWWEVQNIPDEIVYELRRRKNSNNLGMSVPKSFVNVTYNFEKNHNTYKGPLTPWVRIFSNSTGKPSNFLVPGSKYLLKNGVLPDYDGFILYGGEGFFDAWGYKQNKMLSEAKATIGYWANGKTPHYIDEKYRTQYQYTTIIDTNFQQNNSTTPFVPPPAIESINVKQTKELLTFASFKFKCFGLAQLEYLTPFFLTPGINVFIEFGWNLFNQKSLIDLTDPDECWEIACKPQTALDRANISYGNYGCVTGIITKYNFTTNDGFVYECNVEITSRQALYAGMPIDAGPTSIPIQTDQVKVTDDSSLPNYVGLKTFVIRYFPEILAVIRQNDSDTQKEKNKLNSNNFFGYIYRKILDDLERTRSRLSVSQIPSNPNVARGMFPIQPSNVGTTDESYSPIDKMIYDYVQIFTTGTSRFYGGKSEDRVFCGRNMSVYKKPKNPDYINQLYINYGSFNKRNQISNASYIDFDVNDDNNDAWIQLDFLFEVFNIFMASRDGSYKLNYSDQLINAHPNLISCDKRVLIPNAYSPKINHGRRSGGFLKGDDETSLEQNNFLSQQADYELSVDMVNNAYKKNANGESLSDEESYYLACLRVRNVFKTAFIERDDLDVIINYLYYKNNEVKSASFPIVKIDKTENKSQHTNKGYLKHIYVDVKAIIDVFKDSNVKNYKELLHAILKIVNESVGGFWKFEIVDDPTNGISIIDKNYVDFSKLKDKIYTFEIGSTNNVVRNVTFDVSLSNEQSVNVLFGSTNNNLKDQFAKQISQAKSANKNNMVAEIITVASNIPPLRYNDRLDFKTISGSLSSVPGVESGILNTNKDIEYLQTYGDKRDDLLCVTVDNTIFANKKFMTQSDRDGGTTKNYKFLCLPSSMKGKLNDIIDDLDFTNNRKYSGIADNFQVSLTFDGIFSFRNLQTFAINNLPKPYVPGNVIFQVLEVEHSIIAGSWKTIVTALVRSVGHNNLNYEII